MTMRHTMKIYFLLGQFLLSQTPVEENTIHRRQKDTNIKFKAHSMSRPENITRVSNCLVPKCNTWTLLCCAGRISCNYTIWPVETGLKCSCRQNKAGTLTMNMSLKQSISVSHHICRDVDFISHGLWNTNDLKTATTDLRNSSQQINCLCLYINKIWVRRTTTYYSV